jgi:hypothetical protein
MTAGDEGRAAARRAEERIEHIRALRQLQRARAEKNGGGAQVITGSDVDLLLAECDRRSRAVEVLRQAQDAGKYALALMRNRLSVEAPMNADIIRGYITKLEAALASPAPAAEDGDA